MKSSLKKLVDKAYAAFNSRDIDAALTTFHHNVEWPKAFKGGYVKGHEEVRAYWLEQWGEINPKVQPIDIKERNDQRLEIRVQQKVYDLEGKIL